MNVGDTVIWKAKDEQGKFSHKGLISFLTKERVSMIIDNGVIEVSREDGEFNVVKAAKGVVKAVASDTIEKKTTKKATVKKTATSSKSNRKTQAIELYNRMKINGHPARKVVIQAFVDELGMTTAGASTYQYNCKNEWCA